MSEASEVIRFMVLCMLKALEVSLFAGGVEDAGNARELCAVCCSVYWEYRGNVLCASPYTEGCEGGHLFAWRIWSCQRYQK